ncbi:unnamed protein product [Meganyctiphanes norvegica]|uniref:Uncharacterized protein n=1 Tax=Meganyctiphanes norvegica TaxID=48144 RepID=A0AAV2S8T0_MEGNR
MAKFLIKHKTTGKFVHLQPGGMNNDNTKLLFCNEPQDDAQFTFEPVDGVWGYLKHISSGKYVRPYGAPERPEDFVKLVIHQEATKLALFAIDQINHWLIHKDGKYVHASSCLNDPDDSTPLALHGTTHGNMTFLFVSPEKKDQEVFPKWG